MQLTQFRKTEIENFDSRARQKDIAGLYVAMNDPTAVGVRKRRCNLDGVLEKLLHRKRTSCQSARERFPFEKFHHQVPHTGVLTDVVHGTNPRMVEPGGKPRFLVEATMHLCQVAKARADYLDRDVARQPCIPCAVHVPHATAAGQRHDLIWPETCARRERRQHSAFRCGFGTRRGIVCTQFGVLPKLRTRPSGRLSGKIRND